VDHKITITYNPNVGVHLTSEPEDLGFDTALFIMELAKQAVVMTTFDQLRQLAEENDNINNDNYEDVDTPTEYTDDEFTPDDEDILDEDEFVIDEDDWT